MDRPPPPPAGRWPGVRQSLQSQGHECAAQCRCAVRCPSPGRDSRGRALWPPGGRRQGARKVPLRSARGSCGVRSCRPARCTFRKAVFPACFGESVPGGRMLEYLGAPLIDHVDFFRVDAVDFCYVVFGALAHGDDTVGDAARDAVFEIVDDAVGQGNSSQEDACISRHGWLPPRGFRPP